MSKKYIVVIALLFVISLMSSAVYGDSAEVFGPQEMTIKKWHSHLSRHTFDLEQTGDGILEVSKNSPSSEFKGGFIFFNKKFIGLRKFFTGQDPTFEKEVRLKSANRLFVFARGSQGASFTLRIRRKDSYTPEIVSFTASPPMIHMGESSTLAWQTNNAETCEIMPEVGIVDCNASSSVDPLMPTTYTFAASGWGQTVTATVTVAILNSAPEADAQEVTTEEDTALPITLSGSDADDDPFTFNVYSEPLYGTLSGEAPDLIYTPNENFDKSDSFDFIVNDGEVDSEPAEVTIVVNPVNDTPVAEDDTAATGEDNPVVINVLANDEDGDGDVLSVSDFTQPVCGTVDDHGDGTFTYTPYLNYYGNDSFSYTLSDGAGGTDAAGVQITVNPINDAPVAKNQSPELDEDGTISIVLSVSDAENDPLTYEITGPSHGTLSGTAPDLFYTPHADYNGTDLFTYTASDGLLTGNTATVTLFIFAVNDVPVANAGSDKTVYRSDTVTLNGSGSDDLDGDGLSFQWLITSKPSGSTAKLSDPSLVEPGFVADLTGVYEIQLTVNDGTIDSPADTVTINAVPRIVTVPDVLGLKQAVAESMITDPDLDLVVGTISTEHSETVPMDHVISQLPSGGTQVEEYSAVDLVVSLGSESAAPVVSISASPSEIEQGQASVLTWTAINAHSAHIDNGVGTVDVADSLQVFPEQTTTYTITAIGAFGNANAQVVVKVTRHPEPPPEGSYGKPYEDLIPDDATVEEYAPERFALITGRVNDDQGAALSDVSITLHGHAEYGTVHTDDQGVFSIPVEGGGTLTVVYRKQGFIPAQRKVYVPWNDNAVVEAVTMIAEDPETTTLTFDGNPETVTTHTSAEVADEFGARAFTMVFTGDNKAYLVDEDGNDVDELTTITTRATEYSTPDSMPAELPPTSAYTYCAELTVDGADRVRFEKPVFAWVDNFLDFQVGTAVPIGYYDRDRAVWMPSENGVVVKLLDADDDGIVDALDADGDDLPDDLNENGEFSDEILGLEENQRYAPDMTFWRAKVKHFSPIDWNFPFGAPDDAIVSNAAGSSQADTAKPDRPDPKICTGSFVEEKSRVFHEDIAIPDTGMTLHYASSRVAGYTPGVITVPASGDTIPDSLVKIIVEVKIGGRKYTVDLPAAPNQVAEITWDGYDHLGRPVSGSTVAHIRVGFVYYGVYYLPANTAAAFGLPGVSATTILTRNKVILWQDVEIPVARGYGNIAEGWTLSSHHQVDPVDPSTIFKGDGAISRNNAIIIDTFAGIGIAGTTGNGGPATEAKINPMHGFAVDSAGNVYFTGFENISYHHNIGHVRKIDTNGIITTVINGFRSFPEGVAVDDAGNIYVSSTPDHCIVKLDTNGAKTKVAGTCQTGGYSGDGLPATDALLSSPCGLDTDAEGNLYIADSKNNRIRKVDPAGIITTVAGGGNPSDGLGDGGAAVQAKLANPREVAIDTQGNLYIADYSHRRVRKVDPSGMITTVAGSGEWGHPVDGEPAIEAKLCELSGVAVDSGGNFYIADFSSHRVHKVNSKGIITTIAGSGPGGWGKGGYGGDGGAATAARLNYADNVAVDAAGNVYISEWNYRIRKVSPPAAILSDVMVDTDIAFTEENGVGYIMSSAGRHKKTIDLNTGVSLYEFEYDEQNNLISITDQFDNRITIERDSGGVPTAIVSTDGIRTELTIDGNNQLTGITYPDGSYFGFEYTADGLELSKTQPEGNRFGHQFDENGRITDFTDDEEGHWQFFRTAQENGTVLYEKLTAEGDLTAYLDHDFLTGSYTSTVTDPAFSQTLYHRSDNGMTETIDYACGTHVELTYDVDSEYKFKYITEMTQVLPSSLQKQLILERSYADSNEDSIPDLITENVTVNGKITTIEQNTLQSTLKITSAEGKTTTALYNPDSLRTTGIQIPGLHETTFGYDERGRLQSIETDTRQTTVNYVDDENGHQITVRDPEGYKAVYEIDTLDRLRLIQRSDGSAIGFDYDTNGNMEMLVNPAGIEHSFDHNDVNLTEFYNPPLSDSYRYVYDKDRRLTEAHFPSGRMIRNVIVNGRLEQVDLPEPENDIDLIYHPCGNKLASLVQGGESINFGYDGSLLTSENSSGTLKQDKVYTYNNDFRIATFNYAGQTESYIYDKDNLLTAAGRFSIGRNTGNGLPETVASTELSLVRNFNGFGELDGESFTVSGQPAAFWNVTLRDRAGRILEKTETVSGQTSNFIYTYDSVGRLLTVTKGDKLVEEYRYDPDGTGTRVYEMNTLRGIDGRSYQYSAEDHLLTAGDTNYKYTADGFLTTKTKADETTEYQYSSRGELLRVDLPDGRVIEYIHDPLGRRIAKKIEGAIQEKYFWQAMTQLLAVYDGNDNLLMRFEYADHRMPYAVYKEGVTYYLTYDQVGSLRVVANATGDVIKRIDYDAFGNVIADTNPTFTLPFGFAGSLADQDTGLVRFGFRDYDPDVGRWTAKDPIGFAGGDTDLYGYVLNNPTNLIDPMGLETVEKGATFTISALGWGGNFTITVAKDDRGDQGFVFSLSGGGSGELLGVSAQVITGTTDASSINNLYGTSSKVGGGLNPSFLVGTYEKVFAGKYSGDYWAGGVGAGFVFIQNYGMLTKTGVININDLIEIIFYSVLGIPVPDDNLYKFKLSVCE